MILHIPANDHGAIYVFEHTGPAPAGLSEKSDGAMMAVLGPVVLNTDYVDTITPDMLTEMTLPQLIENGYDMPVTGTVADALREMQGNAILVMSAAFGGQEVDLELPQDVRLVATLRDARTMTVTSPLTSAGAAGTVPPAATPAKPQKSNARISGMVATYALLAMFALVALMIWIGG